MGWGGAQEVPLLTEGVLAIDGCWGRENQFSSETWPREALVDSLIPLHMQASLSEQTHFGGGEHKKL